jgi:ubiquinone/menaquinone biosynthesis C-methylase UbiE
MQPRSLYDFLAPIYARLAPPLFELMTARASQRVRAGAPVSVLEIGVGPGHFMGELSNKGIGRLVGVDLSRKMVGHASHLVKKKRGSAEFAQANGLNLPFADGAFEGVVSLLFLGVLSDDAIRPALLEMTRVLAPGGRIVIASLKFTSSMVGKAWMAAYNIMPDLVGRLRPVEIDGHIAAAGLRVLKEEDIDEFAGVRMLTLVKVVG